MKAADPGAWSRGGLDRCDDCELVQKVQSLPRASAEREAACETLIVRYQALVRSCALRYRESPETTEELMQAGYVGLLKAINNFDPAIGTNLAVYAQPCITGEIKRHFRDTRWQVHVKRSAQEIMPPCPARAQRSARSGGGDHWGTGARAGATAGRGPAG
jgi:RNA polymerase sigma-B factor